MIKQLKENLKNILRTYEEILKNVLSNSQAILKKFLLKRLRPSTKTEIIWKKVRDYSEICRTVKKYRDPGGEEAVS